MAKNKAIVTVICLVKNNEVFKAGDTVYYWDFVDNMLKESTLGVVVENHKEVLYLFDTNYGVSIIALKYLTCVSKTPRKALEITLSELENISDKVFAELQTLE